MTVLGILIAAVPFMFAAIRAATTGTDFRYVWLALTSTLLAAIVLGIHRRGVISIGRALLALCAATVGAYATGVIVGAANPTSMVIVALGFAACSTVGLALFLVARAARHGTTERK